MSPGWRRRVSEFHIASMEAVARPLVPSDERYRLTAEVRHDLGADGTLSVGLNPLTWLEAISEVLERGLFGQAVVGGEGSLGRSLYEQSSALLGGPHALMVTDSCVRLLRLKPASVFRKLSEPEYESVEIVAEFPRSAVVPARMAPYGVQRSRFALAFTDGSRCTLMCTFPSISRALVAELTEP